MNILLKFIFKRQTLTTLQVLIFGTFASYSFISKDSFLANASDYQSPRTTSLGGSGRAGPLLNDATYINPSYIGLLKSYSLSLGYQKYSASGGKDSGYYGRILHASLQDSRTELFKAGAGYTSRQNSNMIHVGAAKDFFTHHSFGIGGKVLLSDQYSTFDINYSQTFLWTQWLQIAFIVDNVLQSEKSLSKNLYRSFNLAAKFNIKKIMMIYLDPHLTPSLGSGNRFGYNFGLELIPFKDLFVRAGLFHSAPVAHQESAHGNGFGLGLGWIGGRTSIDYGFARSTKMQGHIPQANAHTISITLYF